MSFLHSLFSGGIVYSLAYIIGMTIAVCLLLYKSFFKDKKHRSITAIGCLFILFTVFYTIYKITKFL